MSRASRVRAGTAGSAGMYEAYDRYKRELVAPQPKPQPQRPSTAREDALVSSCQKKNSYRSAAAAGRAAETARNRGSKDRLWIYPCSFCEGFHLTKQSPEKFAGVGGDA
jgi:hypothetical protein